MSDDDGVQLQFPIGHGPLRYVAFHLSHGRISDWRIDVYHAHEGEVERCDPPERYDCLKLTEAVDVIIGILSHSSGGYKEINGRCTPR
jgi:hypothetical protein